MKNLVLVSVLVVCLCISAFGGVVISDFDDGTTQGWELTEPVYSAISVVPRDDGYALLGIDTEGGHGGPVITATAPAGFLGNWSEYTALSWEEFIFDKEPEYLLRNYLIPKIYAVDGSYFMPNTNPDNPLHRWHNRYVPLNEAYWKHKNNEGSTITFNEALSNVAHFSITLESSTVLGFEAKIDNITLVPEPSALLLFTLGAFLKPLKKN